MEENLKRISAKEAAKELGYASEYVAYLSRTGKLVAERGPEGWSIERSSLEKYKHDVEAQKALRAKTLSREWRKENREQQRVVEAAPTPAPIPPAPVEPPQIVVIQERTSSNFSWWQGALGTVAGLVLLVSAVVAADRSGILGTERTSDTQSASVLSAVGDFFRNVFGVPATTVQFISSHIPATAVVQIVNGSTGTTTVERTVVRVPSGSTSSKTLIDADMLAVILGEMHRSLRGESTRIIGASVGASIDNLDPGLALTDLTDANIPDTITASNYLTLTGGTLTGTLTGTSLTLSGDLMVSGAQTLSGAITIPYLTATSTTASSFIQASTTRFSVFDTAYFGGSATSTFDSSGALTLASALAVGSGGTGWSNIVSDTLLTGNGSGALATTTVGSGLSLSGGVLSTSFGTTTANTWTALQSFTLGASTTQLSALDALYVGRTATTTIRGDGVASVLPYASSTALTVSGTGYFGLGAFTNTSGTTTIASGQGFTIGDSQFVVQQGSGNVGIGTTTPSSKLSVAGGVLVEQNISNHLVLQNQASNDGFAGGTMALIQNSSVSTVNKYLSFIADYDGDEGGSVNFGSLTYGANSSFSISNPSGNAVVLQPSTGNVGIGETAPDYNLHITNTGDSAIFLEADSDNAAEADNAFLKLSQDNTAVQAIFGLTGDAGVDPENVAYTGTLGNSILLGGLTTLEALQFGTNDTVRMTISTAGNVGIGDTSPAAMLTVGDGDLFQVSSAGVLTIGEISGNQILLSKTSPQIKLNDTTASEDDFWIHVNSNNFYVLADRDDDDSWDGAFPLQLEADTNNGFLFGSQIVSNAKIDTCAEFIALVVSTGTCGSTVFSVSPTLTTPILGVAEATSLEIGSSLTAVAAVASGDILAGSASGMLQYDASGLTQYLQRSSADASAIQIIGRKSRGTTASPTAVTSGDDILLIRGYAADSTNAFTEAARITFDTEGTISGAGVVPGRMLFYTANSAGTITQQLEIGSDGVSTFAGAMTEAGSAVISAANIDTCAEFIALVVSTGTCGSTVFSVSPTFTGTVNVAAITTTGVIGIGTTDANPADSNVAGVYISNSGYISTNRSAAAAGYFGRTDDGAIVAFYSAGAQEGSISVSGTTVSYNEFTGSHAGYIPSGETIERGMLVSLTGDIAYQNNRGYGEPVYGITKASVENDPRILGSLLSLMEPDKPFSLISGEIEEELYNPYLVMAVGNGEMWVVDTGEDLEPGDFLISSGVAGHAMKDPGTHLVSHVVARITEPLDWDTATSTIDGKKHKTISVTYELFDKTNLAVAFGIASSTSQSDFAQSFFGNLFSRLTQWFANAANGIGEVFARVFRAKEMICVGETCVNEDQLKALLAGTATSAAATSTPLVEEPHDPEPEPESDNEIETDDDTSTSTPEIAEVAASSTPSGTEAVEEPVEDQEPATEVGEEDAPEVEEPTETTVTEEEGEPEPAVEAATQDEV